MCSTWLKKVLYYKGTSIEMVERLFNPTWARWSQGTETQQTLTTPSNRVPDHDLIGWPLWLTSTLQQILIFIEDIEKVVDGTIVVWFYKDVSVIAVHGSFKGSVLLSTAASQCSQPPHVSISTTHLRQLCCLIWRMYSRTRYLKCWVHCESCLSLSSFSTWRIYISKNLFKVLSKELDTALLETV